MTKEKKLQEALDILFDGFTVDEFLEIVGSRSEMFCCGCKYTYECDQKFFETDENGEFITDKDGDRIVRDVPVSCQDILKAHLQEPWEEKRNGYDESGSESGSGQGAADLGSKENSF